MRWPLNDLYPSESNGGIPTPNPHARSLRRSAKLATLRDGEHGDVSIWGLPHVGSPALSILLAKSSEERTDVANEPRADQSKVVFPAVSDFAISITLGDDISSLSSGAPTAPTDRAVRGFSGYA